MLGRRQPPSCWEKGRVEEAGHSRSTPHPHTHTGEFSASRNQAIPRSGLPLPLPQFPAVPPLASTCSNQEPGNVLAPPQPEGHFRVFFPQPQGLRSPSGWEGGPQTLSPLLPTWLGTHSISFTETLQRTEVQKLIASPPVGHIWEGAILRVPKGGMAQHRMGQLGPGFQSSACT